MWEENTRRQAILSNAITGEKVPVILLNNLEYN